MSLGIRPRSGRTFSLAAVNVLASSPSVTALTVEEELPLRALLEASDCREEESEEAIVSGVMGGDQQRMEEDDE